MSILLATTVSLGQLCYNAEHDINSAEFMRAASHYQQVLTKAMEQKKSQCWIISNEKQRQEATLLVSMDATEGTLALK